MSRPAALARTFVTFERLHELFSYDPETGLFRRNFARPGRKAGSVAGGVKGSGYRYIKIDERLYLASRLAWLYVHGVWPPDQIDHVNVHGPRDDDRIDNLRLADNSQNAANRRKRSDSASPYKGVFKKHKGWTARVGVNGRYVERGGFASAEEASAARKELAERLHGAFARYA